MAISCGLSYSPLSSFEVLLNTSEVKDTIGGIRSTAMVNCSTKGEQRAKLMLQILQKATKKIMMRIQHSSREQEAQEEAVSKAPPTEGLSR